MRPAAAAALALLAIFALAACGTGEGTPEAGTPGQTPAVAPAPPPLTGSPCPTSLSGTLKMRGVGCSTAGHIVQQFTSEARSPTAVLTVEDFVCRKSGDEIYCSRGEAEISYK